MVIPVRLKQFVVMLLIVGLDSCGVYAWRAAHQRAVAAARPALAVD